MKFFKLGVELFDIKYAKYGGHSQWIGNLFIFNNKKICLDYLIVELKFSKLEYKCIYYDGYHHAFNFWLFGIYWGGTPFKETPTKTKFEIRKDKIKKLL